MPRYFSDELAETMSARMSSAPDGVVRGPGGVRDLEARWRAVRGRVARAIVANPDILSYFRFVLWVRVLRQMDVLQAALDATILATEGLFHEQTTTAPDMSSVRKAAEDALLVLRSDGSARGAGVARLLQETETVLRKEVSRTAVGARIQPKREEALRQFPLAAAELSEAWTGLVRLLVAVRERHTGTPDLMQARALEVPIENLRATAAAGVVQSRETEYAAQLLAGYSAVHAAARPLEFGVRLRHGTGQVPTVLFKDVVAVPVPRLDSLGRVEGFYLEEGRAGRRNRVSPALLGIIRNDFVFLNGTLQSAVTAVDDEGFSITPREATVRTLLVSSAVWAQTHVRFPDAVDRFFIDTRGTPNARRIDFEETFSGLPALLREPPDTTGAALALLDTLATFYRMCFSEFTPAVESALLRMRGGRPIGGIVPATPLRQVLPQVSASIASVDPIKPGRAILSMLRAEGFDRAAEMLLWGKTDEVMTMDSSGASYAGHVTAIASGHGRS